MYWYNRITTGSLKTCLANIWNQSNDFPQYLVSSIYELTKKNSKGMGLLNDGKLLTYIYNRANKTIEFVFREICFGPDSEC